MFTKDMEEETLWRHREKRFGTTFPGDLLHHQYIPVLRGIQQIQKFLERVSGTCRGRNLSTRTSQTTLIRRRRLKMKTRTRCCRTAEIADLHVPRKESFPQASSTISIHPPPRAQNFSNNNPYSTLKVGGEAEEEAEEDDEDVTCMA
ncbi:hypothetical protein IFR05_012522 [Cadophora sp. M221]|nr:hypothetical protein IFR05_012522 [Cadophora sp. M221]